MIQKKMIQFVLNDLRNSIIAYFCAILLVFIYVWTTFIWISGFMTSVNGLEFSQLVFIFVVTVSSTYSYIKFFAQSGYSRKTSFINITASILFFSFILTLISQLMLLGSELLFISDNIKMETLFEMQYLKKISDAPLISTLWLFLFTSVMGMSGYLINSFYARLGSLMKVIVSVFVPVTFVVVLPIIDVVFLKTRIYGFLFNIGRLIMGMYKDTISPWLSVGVMSGILAVISLIIYYLLIKKMELK